MRHDRGSIEPHASRADGQSSGSLRTISGSLESGSWEEAVRQDHTYATLLGVSDEERDAIRIIMAAQVRLRLLRMQLTGCLNAAPEHVRRLRGIRQRARLIAQARDTLLHSAIESEHAASAAR